MRNQQPQLFYFCNKAVQIKETCCRRGILQIIVVKKMITSIANGGFHKDEQARNCEEKWKERFAVHLAECNVSVEHVRSAEPWNKEHLCTSALELMHQMINVWTRLVVNFS